MVHNQDSDSQCLPGKNVPQNLHSIPTVHKCQWGVLRNASPTLVKRDLVIPGFVRKNNGHGTSLLSNSARKTFC